MRLEKLISNFYEANLKLREAIKFNPTDKEICLHDQRTYEALHAIKEYKPEGFDELKGKFRFFVERLKSDIANSSDAFTVDSLVHMLDKDFSTSSNIMDAKQAEINSVSSDENKFKLVNAYDLVSKSHDRISIIDKNYRYVNTSAKNGAFYGQKSHKIIGHHVGEIIGTNRFESRARNFFDTCFSGRKKDYFHSLEIEGESRIISCQMTPLYSGESTVFGSMVAINDVTDMVANPDSILLQELN